MALTRTTTKGIANDAVTGTKIADNAINSEHYTDGSIDNAHIADDQIDSEHYVDGSIDLAHMSTNSVDSDQYVDGSIDLAHMSANSVDSDQYVDGSIDLAHMSANSVDSDQYVDGSIDNAHLADDAVGVAELSATGTASSSTYLRGDNTWATVAATLGGGTGVDFNDTVKVRFGTDNDLELYHDGSNAWISNTTGNLIIRDTTDTVYIQAPSIRFQDDTTNEDIAKFISDGACELYYDNVKKLETTSVGAHVWGNLQFVDTAKIQLGTLLDLEIYHDGTNSLIKNNTNILSLQGDDIRLLNNAASEAYLKAANNGAVQLFYDSSLKFETSSTGAQVTGDLGIGCVPAVSLEVEKTIDVAWSAANSVVVANNLLRLENPSTNNSAFAGMQFRTGDGGDAHFGTYQNASTANDCTFYWSNQTDSGAKTLATLDTATGDLTINNGNLVVGTAGKGIDFSAQTATSESGATTSSELLDHYEEGTWTPVLTGSSGGSYTMNGGTGNYIRVGKSVTISFTLSWSAAATAYSGTLTLQGLPFSNGSTRCAIALGPHTSGIYAPSGYTHLSGVCDPSQASIYLTASDGENGGYTHSPTVASSGAIYGVTGTYLMN